MADKKKWKRYEIKPHERGHRKRVSDGETTKRYSIVLGESMYAKLIEIGPDAVRYHLQELMVEVEANDEN